MFASLRSLHRFFVSQAFYPLALSSGLALGLFIFRWVFSQKLYYANFPWNLFLAWVPYLGSMAAAAWQRLYPKRWWVLPVPGLLWLVFFPNAPYIVTDFYHLELRPPVPLWYDIGLIAAFAWTGCFLGIVSLHTMQSLVERYTGHLIGWIFALLSLVLGGLGIYLGRFGRYNSWDLISQPRHVLQDLAVSVLNPLDNLRFIGFTLLFIALLFVFYLTFTSLSHRENVEK